MSASFKHRLAVWVWNGFNAVLSGLCTGAATALGIGAVNTFVPGAVIPISLRQFGITCLISAASSWIMFVRNNSLPSIDTENGTISIPNVPKQ